VPGTIVVVFYKDEPRVSGVDPLLFVGMCIAVEFNGVPLLLVLDPVSKLSNILDPEGFPLYAAG
jgi:hypothetical protein